MLILSLSAPAVRASILVKLDTAIIFWNFDSAYFLKAIGLLTASTSDRCRVATIVAREKYEFFKILTYLPMHPRVRGWISQYT